MCFLNLILKTRTSFQYSPAGGLVANMWMLQTSFPVGGELGWTSRSPVEKSLKAPCEQGGGELRREDQEEGSWGGGPRRRGAEEGGSGGVFWHVCREGSFICFVVLKYGMNLSGNGPVEAWTRCVYETLLDWSLSFPCSRQVPLLRHSSSLHFNFSWSTHNLFFGLS